MRPRQPPDAAKRVRVADKVVSLLVAARGAAALTRVVVAPRRGAPGVDIVDKLNLGRLQVAWQRLQCSKQRGEADGPRSHASMNAAGTKAHSNLTCTVAVDAESGGEPIETIAIAGTRDAVGPSPPSPEPRSRRQKEAAIARASPESGARAPCAGCHAALAPE